MTSFMTLLGFCYGTDALTPYLMENPAVIPHFMAIALMEKSTFSSHFNNLSQEGQHPATRDKFVNSSAKGGGSSSDPNINKTNTLKTVLSKLTGSSMKLSDLSNSQPSSQSNQDVSDYETRRNKAIEKGKETTARFLRQFHPGDATTTQPTTASTQEDNSQLSASVPATVPLSPDGLAIIFGTDTTLDVKPIMLSTMDLFQENPLNAPTLPEGITAASSSKDFPHNMHLIVLLIRTPSLCFYLCQVKPTTRKAKRVEKKKCLGQMKIMTSFLMNP